MSDKGLGQLERLTAGETQLINRRRRGETQTATARRLGISRTRYGLWERGILPCPRVANIPGRRLMTWERCLLYRRRAGYTQAQVAGDLGCCRWWVNQMERGDAPCDALLWYWEQ